MVWGDTWYQPVLFYLTAAALKLLPLTETSVRLPAALLGGLIAPLLLYLLVMRLMGHRLVALTAALLLALSPAEVILSRQALDYICPLPFVLGWLYGLVSWQQTRRGGWALAAGLALGVGFYSYIASWVLMPIYLAMSGWIFYRAEPPRARPALLTCVGCAIPILVIVPWLWANPAMLQQTMKRYQMSDQEQASLLKGTAVTSAGTVIATAKAYASFFDPTMLFVRGGPVMTTSTQRTGAFLVPMALLVPVGLYALWIRRERDGWSVLVLAGLLTAPIPAAIKGEAYMIQRAMYLAVFACLISAYGLEWLRCSRSRLRVVAAVLLLAAPVQFAMFYRDYFTHYKLRSAFYYDAVTFADVATVLLQSDAPAFYLEESLDDVDVKWRFYATKFDRLEVLNRTHYFGGDGVDLRDVQPGSLLVIYVDQAKLTALAATKQGTLMKVIRDVDDREAAAILRRVS